MTAAGVICEYNPFHSGHLRDAESKLRANQSVSVRDSTKYIMSTIYNCITEAGSDLMVDPYLNSLRSPPGKGRD